MDIHNPLLYMANRNTNEIKIYKKIFRNNKIRGIFFELWCDNTGDKADDFYPTYNRRGSMLNSLSLELQKTRLF